MTIDRGAHSLETLESVRLATVVGGEGPEPFGLPNCASLPSPPASGCRVSDGGGDGWIIKYPGS